MTRRGTLESLCRWEIAGVGRGECMTTAPGRRAPTEPLVRDVGAAPERADQRVS